MFSFATDHRPSAPSAKQVFVYENDNVDSDFVCSICQEPLVDPVVEPECRQMFCRECLGAWLMKSSSCPQCRQPTALARVMLPPRFVTARLDDLRVVCPSCGCSYARKSLHEHVAACPACMQPPLHFISGHFLSSRWAWDPVCGLGCGSRVAPGGEKRHEDEECTAKVVACRAAEVGCEFTAPRGRMPEHEEKCPLNTLRVVVLHQQETIEMLTRSLEEMTTWRNQQSREIDTIKHDVVIDRSRSSSLGQAGEPLSSASAAPVFAAGSGRRVLRGARRRGGH
ncbi:zinc finger, C3HC4 type (RING finger) domain containing protein [Acanthamoeba castellanii str. Neff]|uniref:Zinc finger, C3HC4 type (RING finger) domain containing protein n=1 Tax=Acanthamoeba castellanii (strain ATCC 30010 / Neff) TaxID=1257118 RepID=L8GFB1_ACACF|nr:zinc finger, C3HC4 type (RING finger) domain containing protein [Acanthamoeba castellanii str. Neff]ELR11549.1 zinc finger, C3HC4 type (RING finger) domain containing protein [Acanthamoeba castellanii str. Neff]